MTTILKVMVGVACLPLSLLALRSMFGPASLAKAMGLETQGRPGLNTVRSVIGGLFFACVTMLALGLVTEETVWFLAVAVIMGVVAMGRIVGIVADGFDKKIVPPLVVELTIGCLLIAAHINQA